MAINNLRLKNLFDRFGYLEEDDQSQQMEPLFPQPVRPVPMVEQSQPKPIPDLNLDPYIDAVPTEIMLHEMDPRNVTDNPSESGKRFQYTPPPPVAPPKVDPLEKFKNWKPETGATDAFNKYIGEMPQRGDPGVLRRIAASAASIRGGPKAAEDFMYGGYNREMEDWKARGGPLHQAANLERYSNVNERQLQGQLTNAELAQQKIDETAAKNRESAEIARKKNQIADYIARNPKAQVITTGPMIQIFDPATKKVITTDVPSGQMTELDLENARTARATSVAGIYAGARGATERPADVEKKVQNVLREQYSRNSKYRKFIEDNGDGTYSLSNPADWWSPSQQDLTDYSELLNMTFSSGGQQPPSPNMSRVPTTPEMAPPIVGDETNMSVIPGAGSIREPQKGDKVVAGEPIVSGAGRMGGPGKAGGPGGPAPQQEPIIQYSASTKSHRGSIDGGKTWMYSIDGGKTWTTTPPKKVQ